MQGQSDTGSFGQPPDGLVVHYSTLIERWIAQRRALVLKWDRNRAAFERDAKLDPGGKWKRSDKKYAWQSDSIFDVTHQKVTTGHAILTDTMFIGGRVAFMLTPDVSASEIPGLFEGDPAGFDAQARALDTAAGEKVILRQLEACDAPEELSDCFLDAALFGECYVKRFVMEQAVERAVPAEDNVVAVQRVMIPSPAIERKSPYAILRDRENDDRLDCDGVAEKAMWNRLDLQAKIGKPLFVESAIRALLANGQSGKPDGAPAVDADGTPPERRAIAQSDRDLETYEIWGRAPQKAVKAFERWLLGEGAGDEADPDEDPEVQVECTVTLCARQIIRFARTEPEDRPYYWGYLERNRNGLGGVSIADNVEGWQTSLNGALRSLEDGVKLVTNVILAIKRRYLETDVEDEEIFNGRILDLAEDCDDARKAIQQVLFQDVTGPLREVITMFISFADLSSMIPRAEQGQQSENPQTAYELRERLRQAGKYLGGVVRNFDRMIEDIVKDFYRANLANPLVQGGKLGLYRVKALGFTSFENRFVRAQSLMNLLSIILQSEDLKAMSEIRWIWEEIIKGHDIDPDQVIKTPETMEAEARGKQEELAALQASEASAQAGGMPPDPNANLLAAKLQAEIEKLLAESNLRRTEADIRARQATNEQAQALAGLRAQTSQPTPAAAK